MRMPNIPLPRELLARIAMVLAILGGFYLVVIQPDLNARAELKRRIRAVRASNEEQKILYPVSLALAAKLKTMGTSGLPMVKHEPLPRSGIPALLGRVERLASATGLGTRFLAPDPDSLAGKDYMLLLHGDFRGPLNGIRNFLVKLGSLESVYFIERVRLSEDMGEIGLNVRTRVALAGE